MDYIYIGIFTDPDPGMASTHPNATMPTSDSACTQRATCNAVGLGLLRFDWRRIDWSGGGTGGAETIREMVANNLFLGTADDRYTEGIDN